jgi:hypothetical protein
MMRIAIRLLICALPLTGLTACKKFLDTPQKSQLSLADFWRSAKDAELGVAAIYNAAQVAFEINYWRWGELRADNFINNDRPNANNSQIVTNQLTTATAGADWSELYTAILTANMAISKIPDIPDFAGKQNLLAEAHALRALFYFYAVRVWGAVPKITEPVEGLDQDLNFTRSPVKEIYEEIILPDIDKAGQLMTAERSINRLSRGSILALKAEVLMWPGDQQNYALAVEAITELESLGYSLENTQTGWINIFKGPENSKEIIFSLGWNFNEDGGNSGVGQFSTATTEFVCSEDVEQKWNSSIPGDFRILATGAYDVEIVPGEEFPYLRILTKYSPRFTTRDEQSSWSNTNERDIIFYRLSDLILLKAEAENYLDHPGAALGLVNRVRTARGLPEVDTTLTYKTVIRDLILNERQFELIGEGHRYWDLVRNNVVLQVMEPINGMSDPQRILWPIAQNVLNRNAGISQNEGY